MLTNRAYRVKPLVGGAWCIAIVALSLLCLFSPAFAESPAPNVHWGALAYPDQGPVLETGYVIYRFTEFNGQGERFNDIRETIGLNLATLSWTEHWNRLQGWSTNLTFGIGPTADEPSRFLQNDFVHDSIFGFPKVPVGAVREATDFMVDGSLTKWWTDERTLFTGVGFSTGSLYQEGYVRAGLRRWSPVKALGKVVSIQSSALMSFLEHIRFSGMGRYGRIGSGAAFPDVASRSWLAQGSVALGWLTRHKVPLLEFELGVTIDSGLFVDGRGDSLEERFWTFAIRAHPFRFETWNDQLNRKDFGPTYGASLMVELYQFLPETWQWRESIW